MTSAAVREYPAPTVEERQAAKDIICDIIAAEGGVFDDKTRLFKAFYYAHLIYHQQSTGVLSTYPIVHMPHGPGIDRHKELLQELRQEGKIDWVEARFETLDGESIQYSYRLACARHFDNSTERGRAIQDAVNTIRGKGSAYLSQLTHERSWSWQATEPGQEQNIYVDVLSREEFQKVQQRLAVAANLVSEVFGGCR